MDRQAASLANKSPETMEAKIATAFRVLAIVYQELVTAIALYQIWVRCSDRSDILNRMRNTQEGVAFDVIRDAVHMSLVQGLMRLHDPDKRAASIRRILHIVQENEVVVALKSRNDSTRLKVETEIALAIAVSQSPEHKRHLSALKALRDQFISHRDLRPIEHGAKYGFERKLLTDTLEFFKHLDLAVRASETDLDDLRDQFRVCADKYWSHVAQP
jgi:hypothetical protein